jgi:hypothetical protein
MPGQWALSRLREDGRPATGVQINGWQRLHSGSAKEVRGVLYVVLLVAVFVGTFAAKQAQGGGW